MNHFVSDPALTTFWWAAGASIAVDVVALNRVVSSARHHIPSRYRSWTFWTCRALLALAAGALAVAHGASSDPWPAVQIGVAAPLLVERLGRGWPPQVGT